jgi:hypothetical protein
MTYQPATFADFLDGLSRAMGMPVARPDAPDVRLPDAPTQDALRDELDAVVAEMLLAGDLRKMDPAKQRGKGREMTYSDKQKARAA